MAVSIREFYNYKIKRSMLCPSCQEGKLKVNNKSHSWECDNCDYSISVDEFDKDYVFWFCDECNVFLNNQDGFDSNAKKHICTNCGYENDLSISNIKGICVDCGKLLDNKELSLCPECRQKRREKAQKHLATTGKIIGATALVVGTAFAASKLAPDTVDKVVAEAKNVAPKLKNTVEAATQTVEKVVPKAVSNATDVVKNTVKAAEPLEKVLYTTNEWKGYGKQNYFCNQYKLVGDKIIKYKLNRHKFFDDHENEWVHTATKIASYAIDELENADLGWLKKYL